MRYKIYQGETFSIAVSKDSTIASTKLDIVIYNDDYTVTLEDVDSSATISATETAKMPKGVYTIEAKAVYSGRLYTTKVKDSVVVVDAESRNLLLEEESVTSPDAGLVVNVAISDAAISLSLSKGEGGGDVTALTARVAADEVVINSNKSRITTLESGKADKTELTAYAKIADVATTYATKTELASKADTSALSAYAKTVDVASTYATTASVSATYATKTEVNGKANTPTTASDIPAISELIRDTFVDLGELSQNMIVTVTNSLYELNVAFSCGDEAYSVTFSGGYLIGEYTIEANKSYLMSICNSNVIVVERVENE